MPLTSRQRLLRLFGGQEIDRVPVWLLAPFHPLPCYADIYRIPAYAPVVRAIEAHCDTFDRRRPDMGFCYNAHPGIAFETFDDGVKAGSRYVFEGRAYERHTSRAGGRTAVRYYVDEPEALRDILLIPYLPPRPPLDGLRREKEELGERGLLMMDLGDPLEPLYHLCSAEDFSMWSLTDYDMLLEFTDVMYRRVMDLYRYYLESGIPDAYFIVGAEFAGPPLVSPAKFGELCQRYVKGLVDLIRGYGKASIVHFHGQLRRILPEFAAIRPDGLHTVEAPPIGDCSLTMAREALGSHTVLIGNIQYSDLAERTPEEIHEMVRDAVTEGKAGPFILSPTAGPFDPSPAPRLIENYLAFIRAGIAYGGYE